MSIIVVEERLTELFSLLPEPKPKYHFGDDIELNKFIKGSNGNAYPLIYQTSLEKIYHGNSREVEVNPLQFFIAVQTNTDLYNTERWATSYREQLMPLLQNIMTVFEKSNIVTSTYDYTIREFPNYGAAEQNSKEHKTIDIIDAIQVSFRATINGNCITKNIKF